MKLLSILEAKALNSLYSPDRLAAYKAKMSVMPKFKRKHSKRVANSLAKAGLPGEVVDAGMFHDYIERGGNHDDLRDLEVNDHSMQLIGHMTNPNKDGDDDPLTHLREVIPTIADERLKNHLCLLKSYDRVDNILRRLRKKKLTKSYLKASVKLFTYLASEYTGSPGQMNSIMKRLHKAGVKI